MMLILWHLLDKYSSSTPLKPVLLTLYSSGGSSLELTEVYQPTTVGKGSRGGGSITMYMLQLPQKKLSPQGLLRQEAIPSFLAYSSW